MAFLVGGANTLDSSYEIENSLRFGGGNSYLSRQFSGANTSRKTFTLSCWLKRSELGERAIIGASTTSNFYDNITFSSTDQLDINNVASGSDAISFKTSMKFRDVSAWYHIVFGIDTTEASGSDGIKIYINGVLQTSLATSNYTQNATFEIGRDGSTTEIGRRPSNSDYYNVGYLSDFYYIDGQQKAASDFGETNDNGVWIPKEYDGTYGNNGFKLEFKQTGTSQNSSGIGADTSGQDEHFAVTNLAAIDVTVDTPTNNFATMNPLANFYAEHTFSEGNCKVVTQNEASHNSYATSTMGVANGKWYAEFKASAKSGGNDWFSVGVAEAMGTASNLTLGRDTGHTSSDEAGQIGWLGYGTDFVYQNDAYYSGSTSDYDTAAYGVGDILSVALDADNNRVYFYKNGTIQNSGTHFNIGASPTGFWHFAVGDFDNINYTWECNFGNPSNSISSGNADANGYGNFEYSVPSGYYALCTKNLAEYG